MNASALADEEGRKLFIGGLSFDAREDDLRNDFGKFGDLEDLQLPYVDGKHKGFAFLTYLTPGATSQACVCARLWNLSQRLEFETSGMDLIGR